MKNIEERTLSIIKPDAVERNLENEIKNFFLKNGLKIVDSKKIQNYKRRSRRNFTKYINLNHFITITYVYIYPLDQ